MKLTEIAILGGMLMLGPFTLTAPKPSTSSVPTKTVGVSAAYVIPSGFDFPSNFEEIITKNIQNLPSEKQQAAINNAIDRYREERRRFKQNLDVLLMRGNPIDDIARAYADDAEKERVLTRAFNEPYSFQYQYL
jgi:hypothetical protein